MESANPSTRKMQSDSIGKLAEALAKAQGDMDSPKPNAKNPFFKSEYADLESIKLCSRQALKNYGLSVIQTTEVIGSHLTLITTLAHSSGEWIKGEYPINPVKNDPQGVGSAISYARRYAKLAILDLPPKGDEDDGEAANGRKPTSHPHKPVVGGHVYKVPFGPYIGKGFAEIGNGTLEEYCHFLIVEGKKKGKSRQDLPPAVIEFLDQAESYLKGEGHFNGGEK